MAKLTNKQKSDFADHMFSDSLEGTIDWINDNMDPDQVYGKDELKEWIQINKNPEDIFEEDQLTDWAKRNGYILEE